MTVGVETPFSLYNGDGSTTTFAPGFTYASASDIVATVGGAAATWSLIGGNVVFASTPPVGTGNVLIQRQTARAQLTNLTYNGSFSAPALDIGLDRLMRVSQEIGAAVGQAISVPLGETLPKLPAAAVRAGKYLAFDVVTGAPIALAGSTSAATNAALVSFLQPGTGAVATSAQTELQRFVWVDQFGNNVGTGGDDTAAIQAAINAVTAAGGVARLTPGKVYRYTALSIIGNGAILEGGGEYGAGALRCTATSGVTITITGQYSGLRNICLQGSQPFGGTAPSSGFAVKVLNSYHAILDGVRCEYHCNGVLIAGSTETRLTKIEMRYLFGTNGVQWYTPSGSGGSYGGTIVDFTADNPYSAAGTPKLWATSTAFNLNDIVYTNNGIYQCVVAGTSASSGTGPNAPVSFTAQITDGTAKWRFVSGNMTWIEQNSNSYSIRLSGIAAIDGRIAFAMRDNDNTGSSFPMWSFLWDFEADHSHYAGVSLEAGQGCQIDGSWIGSQIAGPAVGGNGTGVQTTGTWQGECSVMQTRIFGCAGTGILNGAGIENVFAFNNIAACGQATTNTYNGITVGAGVSRFKIIGNTIGKLVSGTGSQYAGILVIGGASDYYVITGNVSIGLADGGTGTNKVVGQNIGDAGFGFATGSGGSVAQATSKSTGVTLSKPTGDITMNAASLAASTAVAFTLTNTLIAATDQIVVTHASGGTAGAYAITAQPAAGSATVTVRNLTAGALAEAIVLRVVVIKAANA